MAGGMIGSGQVMRTNALQSMQRYASLDAKMQSDQKIAEQANAAAEKAQNAQLGAATGMSIGMIAGPYGAAVGALIGGIAGSLF